MNFLVPMTPATTGPQWMPIRKRIPSRTAASIRLDRAGQREGHVRDAHRVVVGAVDQAPATMYASPIVFTFSRS